MLIHSIDWYVPGWRRLLAIYLQLSAVMYQGGAPPIFIWITLGALGYIDRKSVV